MKQSTISIIKKLAFRYPLINEKHILDAVKTIIECYNNNKKVLTCGNGGSAADSQHIVGELMKGFILKRNLNKEMQQQIAELFPYDSKYFIENLQISLPAISLVGEVPLSTAYANDCSSDLVFAQQVLGYGNEGDILIAISTSGNSKNVIHASQIAKVKKMKVISLTGRDGGKLKEYSDILINAPSGITHEIQEYHLPIYHAICASVENEFFFKED